MPTTLKRFNYGTIYKLRYSIIKFKLIEAVATF